ncbi:hypothetical protein CHLNCDRAFT_136632 [Chlorella variabilis]|uniref:ADP-ribosylation/Crystallin J1 n=1 Tax=Chlorella variabilis TaxID=554065 RepID=E1ZKQ5_CHLVA|nr:hypothetical protein CHLNCDRAFT_136632 [Chlorella variabilis]EFN53530.1 hypothetical protein CHLNCDRAFT_136632 [Chlorella variabilis]|eukprot:XP_005845632.1 hypothetical protein CHLNCDRAFT_136632 [Chlorella variabilis]
MDAQAKTRARAAVLGAFVADAATTPLHWIYDLEKVKALLESKSKLAQPEFYPEPSCPFYTYPVGALSPYGDEAYAVLQYGAAHADFDGPGLAQHLVSFFKSYTGRLNGTAKHLVEKWEAGERFPAAAADDSQAHAIVKLAARVEEVVRSQQNNDTAVAVGQAAAAILERVVVQGCGVKEAVSWALQPGSVPDGVQQQLSAHLTDTQPSLNEMVWEVTKVPHCGLPGAFVNALYCAATSDGYVDGVRRNLAAAGDNCSRTLYGSALWAAAEGEGAIPEAWKEQVPLYAELERLTDELLSHREA